MDASAPVRALSPTHRILLLIALLGGLALRLFHLGAESLWYDEAVSVALAQKTLPALVAHTAGDIHPPGYYALLHLWQAVTRPTPAHGLEFLYAWVSLAAGMLILALLWTVGRRLLGEDAALAGVLVAALHPFHIWYAQEVRMYTLGAALALLALYATLRWLGDGRRRWLLVYVVAAAAGMYTLYYFALAVAAIGVGVLILRPPPRRFWAWIGAQVGVLLLYAPWLPILWRQATEPPVPPWRALWGAAADVWAAAGEALASLVIGQTPLGPLWLWAALALLIAAVALALSGRRRSVLALTALVATPLGLLFVAGLAGWPLYHVRYLFPFAAPFALIMGVALVETGRRSRAAGWGAAAALLVAYALSLHAFWYDPAYRADDHRAAVRALAQAWRPGDVIFANAGWITPLLEVYWPQAGDGGDAVPPPLAAPVRLLDVASAARVANAAGGAPLVRSGSVDGDSSLGWGDPASDFFAISAAQTMDGLAQLQAHYSRLWHYRLYDTVSDPGGVVRAWLDAHTTTVRDDAIPGRDFGRLELRDLGNPAPLPAGDFAPAAFGDALRLTGAAWPPQVQAGRMLYADFAWQGDTAGLNGSLRLYDGDGKLVAQADAPLAANGAVGAPPWLPAGPYTLEIVVYTQADGAPLTVRDARAPDSQRLLLGSVQVISPP